MKDRVCEPCQEDRTCYWLIFAFFGQTINHRRGAFVVENSGAKIVDIYMLPRSYARGIVTNYCVRSSILREYPQRQPNFVTNLYIGSNSPQCPSLQSHRYGVVWWQICFPYESNHRISEISRKAIPHMVPSFMTLVRGFAVRPNDQADGDC